jgi:hypothetical protein
MSIEFPLKPKSTSHIEQGQFWAVPFENGGFACGVVLAKVSNQGKTDTRIFLAGLLDWFGNSQPTIKEIECAQVVETGFAHIKSITEGGGEIIGAGYQVLSTPREIENTDSFSTWGYNFISKLASKHATVNK